MPMTKTQIVAHLAEMAAITKKQAGTVLSELCELAAKAIKKGDKFAIPGFVTVKVRARKARIGRNPQTGAAIKIPAKVPRCQGRQGRDRTAQKEVSNVKRCQKFRTPRSLAGFLFLGTDRTAALRCGRARKPMPASFLQSSLRLLGRS